MRTRLVYRGILSDQSFVILLLLFFLPLLTLCLSMFATPASASTITAMEYYFDTDPGPVYRTYIDVPPDSVSAGRMKISDISTAELSAGPHLLFIRAKDSDENWGTWRQISFVTLFAGTGIQPVHIDRAEYFIDTDPGEGLGTDVPPPAGEQYDTLIELIQMSGIDTSNLTIGPHTLYVRMHADDGTPGGIWGKARPLPFDQFFPSPFNLRVTGTKTITDMEYFFDDEDPGVGNAAPFPLPNTSGSYFAGTLKDIPTDLLSPGRHILNIRAKDNDGFWGPVHQKWFVILSTSLIITGAEYFIDTDPGQGNGTTLQPVDGSFDEGGERVFAEHDSAVMNEGEHRIFVRAKTLKNSTDLWSDTASRLIQVNPPAPVIDGLSPAEGLIGSEVSISGLHFGSIQSSSTITFNGMPATVASWSDTQIVTTVPSAATTGPVIVTVNGTASNSDRIFTVLQVPAISTLSPTYGFIGDSVTIAGANFGVSQESSTIAFNGVVAGVNSWSDTLITAAVPAGATNGPVVVTVKGIASNNDQIFHVIKTVSLSGVVYGDKDRNGVYSPGEEISDAKVSLEPDQTCAEHPSLSQVVTNSAGVYSFSGIPPCNYNIRVSWQDPRGFLTYEQVYNRDILTDQVAVNLSLFMEIRTNVILTDFKDGTGFRGTPPKTQYSDYQNLFELVTSYHRENSFGLIEMSFSEGRFKSTGNMEKTYAEYENLYDSKNNVYGGEEAFAVDVLCKSFPEGLSNNGFVINHDVVVIVAPIQFNSMYIPKTVLDNFVGIHNNISCGINLPDVAILNQQDITIEEQKSVKYHGGSVGTWSHELGHHLGVVITKYADGKRRLFPDLYDNGNDVRNLDLMGVGSNNNMKGNCEPPFGDSPDLIGSWPKQYYLGWLRQDILSAANIPAGGSELRVVSSPASARLGDPQLLIQLDSDNYYAIEARTNDEQYGRWDRSFPGDKLVLYRLEKVSDVGWTVQVPRYISCISHPWDGVLEIGEGYLDLFNMLRFTAFVEERIDQPYPQYKIQTMIENILPSMLPRLVGIVLKPLGIVADTVRATLSDVGGFKNPESLPDIDLHLYTEDGRHVGINYDTGIYEEGIEGVYTTGDMINMPEWIAVPDSNVNIHFVVSSRDTEKYLANHPEAMNVTDGVDGYELYGILNDPSAPDVFESVRLTDSISAGTFLEHSMTVAALSNGASVSIGPKEDISDMDIDGDGFSSKEEILVGANPYYRYSFPGTTILNLRPGFNLLSLPVQVSNIPTTQTLLTYLGDSYDIDRINSYDPLTEVFNQVFYNAGGKPAGTDFSLSGSEAFIVYARTDKALTFQSIYCYPWDLKAGLNLVGSACIAPDVTAFQLLTDLGGETVVTSIQRFNPVTGRFDTAAYENGQSVGVDFQIVPGEGYFIYMKQERLEFRP